MEKVTGGFKAIPQQDVAQTLIEQVAIPARTLGKTARRKRIHQWQRARFASRELDKARYFEDRIS